MDTKKDTARFVVLLPHRDAARLLEEYRSKLFSLGMTGAYSFPGAAPLARVSRFLRPEELKELARTIRGPAGENEGKFRSSGTAFALYGDISVFGLALELPAGNLVFPETARNKVIGKLPPVLCAALLRPGENPAGERQASGAAPVLSFRAAALANLAIRPLKGGAEASFEWKLGAPVWLPAPGAKRY